MQAPNSLLTHLSQPIICPDPQGLATRWADMEITLRLAGVGALSGGIGAHVRRSFLGALGVGASPEAQMGRACPWDPPCALDVFCREQLRGPRGDGLPKPYVLSAEPEAGDLLVTLRLFGVATEWGMAAAEALSAGLRGILPWSKLGHAVPDISARHVSAGYIADDPPPRAVRLHLLSPMDVSGRDVRTEPYSVLSRMIRRVDGVARWSGVGLDPDASRAISLACRDLRYGLDGLTIGVHHSANRRGEKRANPVLRGVFDAAGDLRPIWPMLRMAERCHIGRHAVEGLGRIALECAD